MSYFSLLYLGIFSLIISVLSFFNIVYSYYFNFYLNLDCYIYSLLVSLFSILNFLYSIYFDFIIDLNSYLITLLISLIVGFLFYYVGRHHSKNITLIDQIICIVLSFLFIPLLICLPYFLQLTL